MNFPVTVFGSMFYILDKLFLIIFMPFDNLKRLFLTYVSQKNET